MKWVHRVTLMVGLILLGGLLWKLGPVELLSQLRLLGWVWVPLILMEGVGEALHATAWRCCLSREHQRIAWLRIAMIRQSGTAFNYLTPTAHMGGEVVRGTLLGREGGGVKAATGVIVGKLSVILSQLLLVIAGCAIALCSVTLPRHLWVGSALSTVLFSSGILGFFILQRRGRLGEVARAAERRGLGGAAMRKVTEWVTLVDEQLRSFHHERPGDFLTALSWDALAHLCGFLQVFIFLLWLGTTAPGRTGVAIWSFGSWFDLIGFIVPAGVGIQEGSRVLIFNALDLAGIAGFTLGVALRGAKASWALVGLGCYGLLLRAGKQPQTHRVGQ